jgi:hypothetical protein
MKKLFLMALAMCFFVGSTVAQISYGPKVGVNISKYGYNYKESWDEPNIKFRFGQSVGAVMNLQLLDFLAFQPSASFTVKGVAEDVSSKESGHAVYTGYDRVRVTYFEVPLNFAARINLGPGNIQFFAGPYVALAIIGRHVWNYERNVDGIRETFKDIEKIKFKNKVSEADEGVSGVAFYQRPLDLGVNFGIGYQYKHLLFNIGFAMGFANLQPDLTSHQNYDPKDYKYSNRTVFITAAWLFGGE